MDQPFRYRGVRGTAATACVVLCIIVSALAAMLFFRSPAPAAANRRVCFRDACVSVEVADTPESRQLGLMFRSSLAEDKGMLFVFERAGVYSFWMKNTLIPLDMLWLDQDLRVVEIRTHVPVCTSDECPAIMPSHQALFVLEVNAGFVDAHTIAVGDQAVCADE